MEKEELRQTLLKKEHAKTKKLTELFKKYNVHKKDRDSIKALSRHVGTLRSLRKSI